MPEVSSHAPGTPSWFELSTSDEKGVSDIYSATFGWVDDPQPIGDNWFYHMQKLNGLEAAAIYLHRDEVLEMEASPHWNTYFTVTNVDETAMEYTLLKAAGDDVAGVMQITEEMGPVPPHWGRFPRRYHIGPWDRDSRHREIRGDSGPSRSRIRNLHWCLKSLGESKE